MVSTVTPKIIVDTDGQLLNALREGSETLQNVTDQFAPLMKRFRIYFFWEQEKTTISLSKAYIVDASSAAPILDNTERSGIAADHSHMCKFENSDAPGYRIVVAALMRYARESPALVESRWSQAKEMLRTQRSAEATELTRGF
ncbi:hypothetical protein HO173_006852 [Letharia columbiana]|uniref:Uncharacterized protein n=1 Tax=Letharia columbiana TaxID=112416 RepID=A0A8H6L459_9LECA|nr:uncharacterized protein HO173_006852 [Letharia columbiana]KAF6234922.1 hypothetical protein HO173_006852 [Letharia columbiana]